MVKVVNSGTGYTEMLQHHPPWRYSGKGYTGNQLQLTLL